MRSFAIACVALLAVSCSGVSGYLQYGNGVPVDARHLDVKITGIGHVDSHDLILL